MKRIALVLVIALGVVTGCGGGKSSPPTAADIAAARACHSYAVLITDAQGKKPVSSDAQAVNTAAAGLGSSTSGSTKWAGLGTDLTTSVGLINTWLKDTTNSAAEQTMVTSGNKVIADCASIPKAAQTAGGYVH